jgi:hypothetical protein
MHNLEKYSQTIVYSNLCILFYETANKMVFYTCTNHIQIGHTENLHKPYPLSFCYNENHLTYLNTNSLLANWRFWYISKLSRIGTE